MGAILELSVMVLGLVVLGGFSGSAVGVWWGVEVSAGMRKARGFLWGKMFPRPTSVEVREEGDATPPAADVPIDWLKALVSWSLIVIFGLFAPGWYNGLVDWTAQWMNPEVMWEGRWHFLWLVWIEITFTPQNILVGFAAACLACIFGMAYAMWKWTFLGNMGRALLWVLVRVFAWACDFIFALLRIGFFGALWVITWPISFGAWLPETFYEWRAERQQRLEQEALAAEKERIERVVSAMLARAIGEMVSQRDAQIENVFNQNVAPQIREAIRGQTAAYFQGEAFQAGLENAIRRVLGEKWSELQGRILEEMKKNDNENLQQGDKW